MKDILAKVIQFRDERNWQQFHNPKDLAISLSLEASELLETFQWKSSEDAVRENFSEMQDEIADVAIYLLLLAHELGIDLEEAIAAKMEKNAEKYPVDLAYGSRKKYTEYQQSS